MTTPNQPSLLVQMVSHPGTYAFGVGVANGLLAAVRDKPISPMAAYITSAVIAAGEVALVFDEPADRRPDLGWMAAWSVVGCLAGIALFTEWTPGQPSLVQSSGERIADLVSGHSMQPVPA